MQFLFPSILWALLLLAIPVIIHLFYFRRFKTVYFSNVKFLKEVKEETSNRNRLRNLLVLLMRLLAMAALIFAFAQPFLADKIITKEDNNNVSIFIDNSFSMKSLSKDIPLLDKAKQKSREIIQAYNENDQFQIITHESSGAQQRWYNKENALAKIDEVNYTPQVSMLSKIQDRQNQIFELVDGNKISYYLSDFQKSISDLNPIVEDTIIQTKLLPFASVQEQNISIDSVWFDAPVPIANQQNTLLIKMTNHSNKDQENVKISVLENGRTTPLGRKTIRASSSIIDTSKMILKGNGWQDVMVKIEDYPIQFDDQYFTSFLLKEKVNILSIHNGSQDRFLNAAISGIQNFSIDHQASKSIQFDKFKDYDLIILTDLDNISSGLVKELENYLSNEGNVLIFPGQNANIDNYNQSLNKLAINTIKEKTAEGQDIFTINTRSFIFSDVYEKIDNNVKLPNVKSYYQLNNFTSRGAIDLLKFRNGKSFLQQYNILDGNVFLCSAPINTSVSNLTQIAEIFVPMIYKMGISVGAKTKIAHTIGQDNLIKLNQVSSSNEQLFRIKGSKEFIPGQARAGKATIIDVNNMIDEAGFYDLELNNAQVQRLAFNFNRQESKLSFLTQETLEEKYSKSFDIFDNVEETNLSEYVKTQDRGVPLWRWCIILALIFLALETIVLRLWKV